MSLWQWLFGRSPAPDTRVFGDDVAAAKEELQFHFHYQLLHLEAELAQPVAKHASVLRAKYDNLRYTDEYGEMIDSGWRREALAFAQRFAMYDMLADELASDLAISVEGYPSLHNLKELILQQYRDVPAAVIARHLGLLSPLQESFYNPRALTLFRRESAYRSQSVFDSKPR